MLVKQLWQGVLATGTAAEYFPVSSGNYQADFIPSVCYNKEKQAASFLYLHVAFAQ